MKSRPTSSDRNNLDQLGRAKEQISGLSDLSKIVIGVAGSVLGVITLILLVVYRSEVWHATIILLTSILVFAFLGVLVFFFVSASRRRLKKSNAANQAMFEAELAVRNERSALLKAVEDGRVAALTDHGELLLRNSETLWFRCPATIAEKKDGANTGNLFVTSMRIVFACGENPVEIPVSEVNAVKQLPEGLQIIGRTAGRTQMFRVGDGEMLAAHISRAVRAFHRQVDVGFERDASRHIPQDVKTAVWERDRGRCVQCEASDYLEFDHIIPHAKGGASTVQNVQLLCRRCNLKKRDAI